MTDRDNLLRRAVPEPPGNEAVEEAAISTFEMLPWNAYPDTPTSYRWTRGVPGAAACACGSVTTECVEEQFCEAHRVADVFRVSRGHDAVAGAGEDQQVAVVKILAEDARALRPCGERE
ncbi:hypothetical protein SRABI76_01782 [Microbacterium oxydans]|nr:hypothetical protein SRABI76_01782 [Microbacterium oxydans]